MVYGCQLSVIGVGTEGDKQLSNQGLYIQPKYAGSLRGLALDVLSAGNFIVAGTTCANRSSITTYPYLGLVTAVAASESSKRHKDDSMCLKKDIRLANSVVRCKVVRLKVIMPLPA